MTLTCGNGNTLQYNTTICFFAQFPLHKSSVPNRCQTSHESLVINEGLPCGQQVQFQTQTEIFSLLACPNQSCGAPPPHAEGHKGVKQKLTATNCQCNLTSSPPMHHSPPWSVKFRNTRDLSTLNPYTTLAWCLGLISTRKNLKPLHYHHVRNFWHTQLSFILWSSSSSIGTTTLRWVSACSTIIEHSQQEGFTECHCQRHV
jgi:hypothetical protein